MLKSVHDIKLNYNNLQKPFMAYIKITNACNLGCFFCSQNCSNFEDFVPLSTSLEYLNKLYSFGVTKVIYTGGEPLMYPYIIPLLKRGRELGLDQSIVTNGTVLKRMVEALPYVSNFGISLHGVENIHDKITMRKNSYQAVIDNIIELKKNYNIPITVNYTFNSLNDNEESLNHIDKFCDENNIELFVARINFAGKASGFELQNLNKLTKLVDDINKTKENKNKLIKFSNCLVPCALDKKYQHYAHGCGAGLSFFALEKNGDVKICATSNRVLGNINTQSLAKIFKNKDLKLWKSTKNLNSVCKGCKHVLSCKGGCRIECENEDFAKKDYDAYFLRRMEESKQSVLTGLLTLQTNNVIFNKNEIVLPISPVKILNNKYFDILTQLDGTLTGEQIIQNMKNKQEVLTLLIELFSEGLVYAKRV